MNDRPVDLARRARVSRRALLGAVGGGALAVGTQLAFPDLASVSTAPSADLFFVKTAYTASGRIEVHSATASSGYQSAGVHRVTFIAQDEGPNGSFEIVGSDLYFIKTRHTASGKIEVHSATAASGYKSAGVHRATFITAAESDNGDFCAASQLPSFRAWALDTGNWNGRTSADKPGIDVNGTLLARHNDIANAWANWMGHPGSFAADDARTVSRAGWRTVPGKLAKARPGDVVTRLGGKHNVAVVVAGPANGRVSVLQQDPKSPAIAACSTSTSGVIWRLT